MRSSRRANENSPAGREERTVPGTVFCSTGGMWDSSLRNIVRGLQRRLKKGSGGLLELLQVFLELWMARVMLLPV